MSVVIVRGAKVQEGRRSRGRDLVGSRFGRLTVRERSGSDARRNPRWLCECECGKRKVVRGDHLLSGRTASCGCLGNERRLEGRLGRKIAR